jgi:hypothetical protein
VICGTTSESLGGNDPLDCLSPDDERLLEAERLGDQRKATREVIAGTAIEPHLPTALAGDDGASHRA